MNDENMIKIMQSLDLNYNPAINSTLRFEKSIQSLNKQLATMKTMAMSGARDINTTFSSQLGGMTSNKTILDQYGAPLKSIQADANKSASSIQNVAKAHSTSTASAKAHAKSVKDVGGEYNIMASEFQRRSGWFLTGALFYGTINAAKEAVTTIKDVQFGMVELARVMDDSTFVFEDYRDNLMQLGVEYGQTFDNVQGIALRWAQSGYNVADSLELTRTSLLALNTAELDVKNSTESMIGIMAQWELKAEDMALVMDKVNITADNYSVTSQDLVDGLLRSSGAAKVMGMSIDDTIGTLTVLREATGRTGREVGNALNSILSYIQRPSSLNILESMGIQTFADEAKTEFRDVMEIFDELATRWKDPSTTESAKSALMAGAEANGLFTEELAATMDMYDEYTSMTDAATEAQQQFTDVQKRDAAQAAAGARRRNYFIGLLERFSKVQDVTNGLINAEGYSMGENADAMDTLEKKTQSLKTSMEQLAVAMGDAGLGATLEGLASGATDAVSAINKLPGPLRDAVLGFTNVFLVVKTLQLGMRTFGLQLPVVSINIKSLKGSVASLTTALKAGAAGMSAFVKANAGLLILAATVGIITAISNAVKKNREEQQKAIEVFKDYQSTHSEINGLINDYKDLAEQTSLTTEQEEKLVDTKQKLIDLLPQSSTALGNENLLLQEQVDIVKDLNEKELERLKNAAYKVVSKGTGAYEQDKKDLDDLIAKQEQLSKTMAELNRKNKDGTITRDELSIMSEGATLAQKYADEIDELTNSNLAFEKATHFLNGTVEDSTDVIEDNVGAINSLADAEKVAKEKMDELSKAFSDSIAKHASYKSMLDEINSKEGLSVKSKQEIIEKHQELAPYLIDENELRKKLIEGMHAQETAHSEAYKTMMNNDETYFTTLVGKNEWLRNQLAKLGNDQLADVTTLAKAKLAIELNLIQTLSKVWSRYYNATYGNLVFPDADTEQSFYNSAEGKNYISIKNGLNKLENLAGDVKFTGGGSVGGGGSKGSSGGSGGSAGNAQLDNALKLLEHRKKITVETYETIKAEIAELNRINSAYAKTQDERMSMAEKIYSAEQRYLDKRLQNSVDWIGDKKALDQLSVDDEIAAWERVKNNQSDNIEAVKMATLNLYKLRNELISDSSSKEQSTIEHLKKLGVLSTEEQIKAYKKLYEVKATSLEEERSRVENLFSLYKDLLSEQQDEIKDAYSKRMDMIDAQAEKDKEYKNDKIKGIQEELDLLDRADNERSHENTLESLQKDLQYWSVRTSEEARKKVIEIQKQIEEEKYKYDLEQQKQSLNDKVDGLKDEISEIDDAAKEEKEKWEKSYKLTEKAFDTHSSNIIALARTMSKEAYAEWESNYLLPLQNALASGDLGAFESASGRLEGSVDGLRGSTSTSNNSQINRLANQILDYKKQYELGGDKNAGERAKSVYSELSKLSPTVANMLHSMGYVSAKDYVYGLPKMHKGGKSLSYGAVEMMPGELTFPPDLSIKLESLIGALYRNPGQNNSKSLTDNRKEVIIDKLVNIERNYMEDEVDSDMFARELNRLILNSF